MRVRFGPAIADPLRSRCADAVAASAKEAEVRSVVAAETPVATITADGDVGDATAAAAVERVRGDASDGRGAGPAAGRDDADDEAVGGTGSRLLEEEGEKDVTAAAESEEGVETGDAEGGAEGEEDDNEAASARSIRTAVAAAAERASELGATERRKTTPDTEEEGCAEAIITTGDDPVVVVIAAPEAEAVGVASAEAEAEGLPVAGSGRAKFPGGGAGRRGGTPTPEPAPPDASPGVTGDTARSEEDGGIRTEARGMLVDAIA